jgi:hypothetical protein
MRHINAFCGTALILCGFTTCAFAQESVPAAAADLAVALIDAPPPPVAPATIARDAQNRATLRAVRVSTPMTIDGRLDEAVYGTVAPVNGFIQQTPNPGEPATEATDVWVLFDDNNVYISMLLHEIHPERRVGSELRRDAQGLTNDDNVMLVIDTFYDRRNAFNFQVNSVGGFRDQLITDGSANGAWNTVWDVKIADTKGGHSFEMVIPFKSLRYNGSGPQVWGFNARRATKWKNEVSYINPNPVAYGGRGINILSTAATLVGIETPARSLNLELKPYAIASLATDRAAAVPFSNEADANIGFDFKYGLTRSLTADLTVNTDFAQVEEDVQQINLSRFSLFFPEKRDFFLEGAGNFNFGVLGTGGGPQGGGSDVPTLFFSRRIGLSNGQTMPVRVGARVTGRVAGYEIGLLNIQTGEKAEAGASSTNFTAARVRRNVFRRSNLGALMTLRRPGSSGEQNAAYGADANLRFYENISSSLYLAGTATENTEGDDDLSYRANFEYAPDRWGFLVQHLKVGSTFDPQMGFLRRRDFRTSSVNTRYSPRLKHPVIRVLRWTANYDYTTNAAAAVVENRDFQGAFGVDFQNSDSLSVTYDRNYEFLPKNFPIARSVMVPRGAYDYQSVSGQYSMGNQRKVSGAVSASRGSFYNGTRSTGGFSGRVSISSRFVLEPGITLNRVALPFGDFSANLLTTRVVITPSPRMQLASLLQYNASAKAFTSSVRLRWEYTPGSDLFVVYSDGRDTDGRTLATLLNRTFAVKATRLLRF